MEKRTKIYIWLIVILLATNLATIASIWYHVSTEKTVAPEQSEETPAEQRTRFLSEQLHLDRQQTAQFREANRNFNRKANAITRVLENRRLEMLEEMAGATPDTALLKNLSSEIGDMHKALKNETIDFYIQMKTICNEEQQTKLYQIFRSMLNQEDDVKTPRGRHQGGRGRNINNH